MCEVQRCWRAGQSFRVGGGGPPELEPGAQVGADHVPSGEDEKGPELGEEARMESC